MDPKTKSTFSSMDSDSGEIRVFGGPNNSGITLDTKPGGNMTIREAGGQVTEMNNQGYFNSVDAQGKNLMSVSSGGDVTFYDGTTVRADGTVSNATVPRRPGTAAAVPLLRFRLLLERLVRHWLQAQYMTQAAARWAHWTPLTPNSIVSLRFTQRADASTWSVKSTTPAAT